MLKKVYWLIPLLTYISFHRTVPLIKSSKEKDVKTNGRKSHETIPLRLAPVDIWSFYT
jgi:hypothetical protein